MKTKELVELVKQGVRPIVKIVDKHGVLEGPDSGMLGRITSIGSEDIWERGTSTIPFVIDFLEFTEHNKPLMVANWYDSNGNPSLTWAETRGYESDAKSYTVYENLIDNFTSADLTHLEIVEENKWLNQYLESGSNMSYIEWLETKLDFIQDRAL